MHFFEKEKNWILTILDFYNLSQQHKVHKFSCNLLGYSCLSCKFDLSECNIIDQFLRGLENNVLQTEILAKATQFKTIDSLISHAEAFETALRDQSSISNTSQITSNQLFAVDHANPIRKENPLSSKIYA